MIDQNSQRGSKWLESQEVFSRSSIDLFDAMAGEEVNVFTGAMELLHACFEKDPLEGDNSPEEKICLAMLSQAYQQLVSCWLDLRSGRLAAAANQWRSISETPDFVLASIEDTNFAREWADPNRRRTLPPGQARKIAKRRLNRIKEGMGDAWAKRRSRDAMKYQPYSHFSSSAAGLTILKPDPSSDGHFFTPEGAYSPLIRQAAKHTALLVIDVISFSSLALGRVMPNEWHEEVQEASVKGQEILTREGA